MKKQSLKCDNFSNKHVYNWSTLAKYAQHSFVPASHD